MFVELVMLAGYAYQEPLTCLETGVQVVEWGDVSPADGQVDVPTDARFRGRFDTNCVPLEVRWIPADGGPELFSTDFYLFGGWPKAIDAAPPEVLRPDTAYTIEVHWDEGLVWSTSLVTGAGPAPELGDVPRISGFCSVTPTKTTWIAEIERLEPVPDPSGLSWMSFHVVPVEGEPRPGWLLDPVPAVETPTASFSQQDHRLCVVAIQHDAAGRQVPSAEACVPIPEGNGFDECEGSRGPLGCAHVGATSGALGAALVGAAGLRRRRPPLR